MKRIIIGGSIAGLALATTIGILPAEASNTLSNTLRVFAAGRSNTL